VPDHELFDATISPYPGWVSRQQFLILAPDLHGVLINYQLLPMNIQRESLMSDSHAAIVVATLPAGRSGCQEAA